MNINSGVNLKLKPEERDLYFQFVETFDYPPGIPKIKFSPTLSKIQL